MSLEDFHRDKHRKKNIKKNPSKQKALSLCGENKDKIHVFPEINVLFNTCLQPSFYKALSRTITETFICLFPLHSVKPTKGILHGTECLVCYKYNMYRDTYYTYIHTYLEIGLLCILFPFTMKGQEILSTGVVKNCMKDLQPGEQE